MEDDFDVINCNFPPTPSPVEEVNGKVICDLTVYDAPTQFPPDILRHQNLQVLKLFTDNLYSIPDGIGNLKNLEQLVLCHFESHTQSNLMQLPVSLKNLKKLLLLDLRRNPLSHFPLHLTTLVSLEELHVNNCNLSSLPDEIGHLQLLKVLDLSNNFFTTLPLCVTKLKNLVRLYISDGVLETLCKDIKNLANLERLQLTNNRLTALPGELFELVNLKKLHLNVNQLSSIDDNIGKLVHLEYLVLNQNKLTRLPDTIGKMSKLSYLNLHENLLTRLPESIANLMNVETLLVENNPLQVPPVHVCNQGIPSIKNYFQAMRNTGGIHSKRLKVFLLGESMAGKTSLVNALVKGEACEINEDDRTFGVVFYHWKPEPDVDDLELLVVDCAGQRKYQMTHQLFFSEGALFLLAVDLCSYKFDNPDCFQTTVGDWIKLLAARIPRARILIVPTHLDSCSCQEDIDLKCKNILINVQDDCQEMIQEIDRKIKYVSKTEGSCIPEDEQNSLLEEHKKKKDSLPVISLHYLEEGFHKTCNSAKDLHMNVLPVSNVGSLEGMIHLRKELVRIARNKDLFPTVDTKLPESWVKVESTMKDLRKSMAVPCVSVTEFLELLNERNVDISHSELDSCLVYLHAIGELLYFKDIPGLLKKIVLNPYWLGSVLRCVFRHDLEEKLIYREAYRKIGVYQFQLNQEKEELFNSGIMTQTLLRCIWSDVIQLSDDIFSQLLTLLTHFGLACELPACTNDLNHVNGATSHCYLMPWFLSGKQPLTLASDWPPQADKTQIEVTAGYALLQCLPIGVFERFSVRCHGHGPDNSEHWQNGICMKFGEVLVLGNVSSAQKCSTLTLSARAPKNKLSNLWKTLVSLLKEVKKLFQEWPGMNYVCFTVCPTCVELRVPDPYHFTCNWFNAHKLRKHKAVCKKRIKGESHSVDLNHLFPSNVVLDELQNPNIHPVYLPDVVLAEEQYDGIAEMLGIKWPQLARKLGIGGKVDVIRSDNPYNTHEQAVKMIATWKSINGENAKRSVIARSLREIGCQEIAEFIERN